MVSCMYVGGETRLPQVIAQVVRLVEDLDHLELAPVVEFAGANNLFVVAQWVVSRRRGWLLPRVDQEDVPARFDGSADGVQKAT